MMSGLDFRKGDRNARDRAQVVLTQDEHDKANRATELGAPEHLRASRLMPTKHWSPKKDDGGIERDGSL